MASSTDFKDLFDKYQLEGVPFHAHYLHALEVESLAQKPPSEMERQDYIDQVNSLKDTVDQFKEMIGVLKQAFASSEQGREQAQKQSEELLGVISNQSKEISLLRKEVSKQTDYNKRHNQMSFGKKSLSSSVKQESKPSHQNGKE